MNKENTITKVIVDCCAFMRLPFPTVLELASLAIWLWDIPPVRPAPAFPPPARPPPPLPPPLLLIRKRGTLSIDDDWTCDRRKLSKSWPSGGVVSVLIDDIADFDEDTMNPNEEFSCLLIMIGWQEISLDCSSRMCTRTIRTDNPDGRLIGEAVILDTNCSDGTKMVSSWMYMMGIVQSLWYVDTIALYLYLWIIDWSVRLFEERQNWNVWLWMITRVSVSGNVEVIFDRQGDIFKTWVVLRLCNGYCMWMETKAFGSHKEWIILGSRTLLLKIVSWIVELFRKGERLIWRKNTSLTKSGVTI